MNSPEPEMSPRRAKENEQFMEELNERMEATVRAIRDENDEERDAPFRFFCECSVLACRDRIELRPSRLDAIHADPERFVVKPGHEIPAVERVVDQEDGYLIVRKIA